MDIGWLKLVPWSAAAKVQDPGEPIIKGDRNAPTNKNFFENFKAQAWWNVSRMFYRTWQMVEGEAEHPLDRLIAIDSSTIPPALLNKLAAELAQATMGQSASTLKLVVDKMPEGQKSPNLGDALIMGRYPARTTWRAPVSMFGPKILS